MVQNDECLLDFRERRRLEREQRRERKRLLREEKLRLRKLHKSRRVKAEREERPKEELRSRRKRAATARPERLWDYAVIPYEIEANFSGKLPSVVFRQEARERVGYLTGLHIAYGQL